MVNCILKDIRAAHLMRWPGQSMSLISNLRLLAFSPSLHFLMVHRMEHWLDSKERLTCISKWLVRIIKISLVPLILLNKIRFKGEIRCECDIDGGVCFSDQGHIIFGAIKAGTGTVINTRVTIGQNHIDGGLPKIGRNVWIGHDCVVYGDIIIGDGATLLPGTILTKSIPSGVVMQGNPARLKCRNFDNTKLRTLNTQDANNYIKITLGY